MNCTEHEIMKYEVEYDPEKDFLGVKVLKQGGFYNKVITEDITLIEGPYRRASEVLIRNASKQDLGELREKKLLKEHRLLWKDLDGIIAEYVTKTTTKSVSSAPDALPRADLSPS